MTLYLCNKALYTITLSGLLPSNHLRLNPWIIDSIQGLPSVTFYSKSTLNYGVWTSNQFVTEPSFHHYFYQLKNTKLASLFHLQICRFQLLLILQQKGTFDKKDYCIMAKFKCVKSSASRNKLSTPKLYLHFVFMYFFYLTLMQNDVHANIMNYLRDH